MGNLVDHAKFELARIGMFDEDADYNGALGPAIMTIIEAFEKQDHSGGSAAISIGLIEKLLRFEPLSSITDNASEWVAVFEEMGEPHWQNRRRSTSFSRDGGKTWYDISDASLNNGDTWYDEEGTKKWFAIWGLQYDPSIVLDHKSQHKLLDRKN